MDYLIRAKKWPDGAVGDASARQTPRASDWGEDARGLPNAYRQTSGEDRFGIYLSARRIPLGGVWVSRPLPDFGGRCSGLLIHSGGQGEDAAGHAGGSDPAATLLLSAAERRFQPFARDRTARFDPKQKV